MTMTEFIVFEGADCTGKSTQVSMLANKLREKYSVYCTAEPTNTDYGNYIRNHYIKQYINDPFSSALAFILDRYNHIQHLKKIQDDFQFIICDRYVWSTFAYQIYSSDMNEKKKQYLIKLNEDLLKSFVPDYVVCLYQSINSLQDRLKQKKNLDIIEKRKISYHKKVLAYYRKVFKLKQTRNYDIDKYYQYKIISVNTPKHTINETHNYIVDKILSKE